MFHFHKAIAILLTTFVASVGAADGGTATPILATDVLSEIKHSGAGKTLQKYYDTAAWKKWIMPGIERANDGWLEVAEKLQSASDGAGSEDLGAGFYRALAVKPLLVLPILARIYGGTSAENCSMTFEAELPMEGVSQYLTAIESGLSSAQSAAEKRLANECRKGLAETRKYAKAHGLK